MNYEVRVSFKPGVLDAEGNAALGTLQSLGFNVSRVGTAKVYVINSSEPLSRVEEMCKKLLANPVIHDYSIAVKKAVAVKKVKKLKQAKPVKTKKLKTTQKLRTTEKPTTRKRK